ncbi:hypothetical protein CLU97_3679 [Chryseobacterium sp. 7]|nr:hypothetical protein CLU97_3679 [Chryseobacterium sp. 7]
MNENLNIPENIQKITFFVISLFCTLGKYLIKWDYKLTTLYAILTSNNLVFDRFFHICPKS